MSEQNEIKNKINESVTSQISKINKIRNILFEVGSALAYVHERNIIHRDIKPENIFISHVILELCRMSINWVILVVPPTMAHNSTWELSITLLQKS